MGYIDQIIEKGAPDPGDVYVRPELTDVSVGYMIQASAGFLFSMWPDVGVTKQQGKYRFYDPGAFMSDEMEERMDGAESAGGGFDTSTKDYSTRVFAWHTDVGPQTRANATTVDMERGATELCSNKAILKKENRFIGLAWKKGVWSTDRYFATGGSTANTGLNAGSPWLAWSDDASNPIRDLRKALSAQMDVSFGYRVNEIAFSEDVFERLLIHPVIVDRFKAGQTPGGPAMADANTVLRGLEGLLSLPGFPVRCRVAMGRQNTAKKGLTAVGAKIATTGVLGQYVPVAPGVFTPSAGYNFNWNTYLGAGAQGQVITRELIPLTKGAQRYEIEMANDPNVVSPDCGFWFETVLG